MTSSTTWYTANAAPFEAFGILYYPLFQNHEDLPTIVDDTDMTWAVTANTNLEGTGYTLSQPSILVLAACHHAMVGLSRGTATLPFAGGTLPINPLADLERLVPGVTATPLYPDFPTQVMEMDEAHYRYIQACHYLSTYGVEQLAGALGLDVSVSEGWRPQLHATPKTATDETLVAPKVLHLFVTVEDLEAVVAARLARATRMHPAEIDTALLVFASTATGTTNASTPVSFPPIAFHENMLALVRTAAGQDAATLERVAAALARHPGDLLKAVMHVVRTNPANHLATRQKKGFCRAFEHFDATSIAQNLVDAGRRVRHAPACLSVDRFGGPHLREALELVESGQVRSWVSELEQLWSHVPSPAEAAGVVDAEPLWQELLAFYGQRPGMLLRALARLVKAGCPFDLLSRAARAHAGNYSLPTLVRTLTLLSDPYRTSLVEQSWGLFAVANASNKRRSLSAEQAEELHDLFAGLIRARLAKLETPLAHKRVFVDPAGVSLAGSLLVPNETGVTGTAWPPVGMAFDLPRDKAVRFFTFWDHRANRVDVDLHFYGQTLDGGDVHIGWNGGYGSYGLTTSGDVTTSHNSVEFLDARMAEARAANVAYVIQQQHIFYGADNWGDISTCYSGALVVDKTRPDVALYDAKNLLFRDDLTGAGTSMSYAVINFPQHYVRIMRGARMPLGEVGFTLESYLGLLLESQGATRVRSADEADVCVCVGRNADPKVISLFDEGFFLG